LMVVKRAGRASGAARFSFRGANRSSAHGVSTFHRNLSRLQSWNQVDPPRLT
jgi:hypothetical protein